MHPYGNNQPKFPMPASGATPAAPHGGMGNQVKMGGLANQIKMGMTSGMMPSGMTGVPAPGNKAAPGSFMNPTNPNMHPTPAQPAAPNQYAAAQAALNGASQFAPGLKPFVSGMGPWTNQAGDQQRDDMMSRLPPGVAEKLRGVFARQPQAQSQPTGLPGMNVLKGYTQPQAPMLQGMLPPVAENI